MLTCGQTSWCLTGYSHAAGLQVLVCVSVHATENKMTRNTGIKKKKKKKDHPNESHPAVGSHLLA